MKWFKHMNEMSKDERVVALEYSCGLEGYAVYLKLLEIIAHQMDSTSGKCWTEYPLKYWAERLRCHHNKVIKIFTEINKVGLAEITCCDEFRNNTPPSRGVGIGVSIGVGNTPSKGWGSVRVEIRNLLKYRDNHSKNLQAKSKSKNKNKSKDIRDITSEDISSSVNIPKLQKISVEAPVSSASEKIKPATYPPDFERFWLAYPANRRKDKPDAFVRWKLALKKADAEKIISAASLYSQSKEAIDGFAPYPAKWLKGERFNDETTITIEAKQVLPDSQKAKNLMYLRDTLQKPLDVQQSTWLKTYENQQGGLANG